MKEFQFAISVVMIQFAKGPMSDPKAIFLRRNTSKAMMYAFGVIRMPERTLHGATRPTRCTTWLPHGNPIRHPMCVRCARPKAQHVGR